MNQTGSGLEALFTLEDGQGNVVEERGFRLLVLGDLGGDKQKMGLGERRAIEIDRDSFDAVMARIGPRIQCGQSGSVLSLDIRELDDLHPDRLYRSVPLFAEMRELRQRLLDPNTFNAAASELRSWMHIGGEEPPPVAEPADDGKPAGLLDAILSGQGGSAPAPRRPDASSEIESLVSELVRPHLVTIDESEQGALLAAIDAAAADLMRRILHDRRFQEIEAAWRGMYLLVRRAETASDLRIFVLDVSKEELVADLRAAADLTGSFLYEAAVKDAADEPFTAIIGNYAFASNTDDVAALIRIGRIAEAAGASFISHMRPDILGVRSLAVSPDASQWDLSGTSDAGKLWSALRSMPEARYLAMTMPRILARLPYGRESEPLETFAFEEFDGPPAHDEYLWTNGAFVAGLLLAQTYTAHGWRMARRLIQDIERLPMHTYEHEGETVYQPCAEVLLSQHSCERLMELGLMPLVSYKNTDHVKLASFQSIADPVTGLAGRWSE